MYILSSYNHTKSKISHISEGKKIQQNHILYFFKTTSIYFSPLKIKLKHSFQIDIHEIIHKNLIYLPCKESNFSKINFELLYKRVKRPKYV